MKLSREINPSGNEATKVTITEDTTIEQLKLHYPMLDVLEDSDGLYIRSRYCRFLPGSFFSYLHREFLPSIAQQLCSTSATFRLFSPRTTN